MVRVKEDWILQHWHYYKDQQVQVGCVVFQNDLIDLPFGARIVHSEVSRYATNCGNGDRKVQPKVIKVIRGKKGLE